MGNPVTSRPSQADLASSLEAYRSGDYQTPWQALQPLAETGQSRAQNVLGEMALRGQGASQAFVAASAWFAKAAANGHTQAMVSYGSLLALGLGSDRDLGPAYFWMILSVVWDCGPPRHAAFVSLGEVASLLSSEEKRDIGNAAVRQWRKR